MLTYFISKRRISGMALLILALLQRIFLMSSLMLLLVWLIFFKIGRADQQECRDRHLHSFPTRRSSDLQQTQNQRYGSSHIGATAKDISNVVTDAASGVVDIFHGIDKAVADTWNNFWKDGKADGIGSNLSRK